jgi:dTMP kinase
MADGTRRGLFITLEGGEGAGKSTQAQLLVQRLGNAGYPVLLTREPGGTGLGRWLDGLLEEGGPALGPLPELLLFSAARAQHVAEVIRPALERGDVVICDRFSDSTLAYQGYGRGLDMELIRALIKAATSTLWPDITLLLDIPPEAGLARKDHERVRDRIGAETVAFHRRVRQGYLALAKEEPARFLMLDGTRPPEQLAEAIANYLRPMLARISTVG